MNNVIKVTKSVLRFLGLVIIKPNDTDLIKKLKEKFEHKERGFHYGLMKYAIDSLDCHASPGVIETNLEFLSDQKKINPDKNKLLNLGGGTGQVADIYREVGFDVYNIDIDIADDKINQKNMRFDLNTAEPLPFENNFFDVVVGQEIIEHIENPWKFFRDAKQLLKDGGYFIVSTPNVSSLLSRVMFLTIGYLKWFTPACFPYHINPIALWELNLIAQKMNFKLISVKGSGDFFFNKNNNNQKKIIRKNEGLIVVFQK